jgi:hypothetical protein
MTVLSAALDYAGRGIPVFPVRPDNKLPLVKWKLGATTEPETVRAWWRRWPLAMIGFPTGARSGWVVLDVDRKGGIDGLANLYDREIDPFQFAAGLATTPTGGLHFYVRHDPDRPMRNSASEIAPGVDVRADGGFVVAPPSRRADGTLYAWEALHAA